MLVAEYETDGSKEIYYWRRFRTLVSDKIKGTAMSREIGIWWSVTRSIYKVRTGEIFDELEVEGFLRERFTEMQATELVIKNSSLTLPSDQKEVFEDMQTMAAIWKHFYFRVHQVLVNQDLKIWQEELTSLTARVYQFNSILLQRQKDGKTYDFIDSEYKAIRWQSWWHRCNIIWIPEFLNIWQRTTSQRFLQWYTNKAWLTLCNHHKASKIRNWAESSKSIIRIWEGQKRPKYKLAEDLIYGLN